MRSAPNFSGLPLDIPLTVGELAAHARKNGGNWSTKRMLRWLKALEQRAIERGYDRGILEKSSRDYFIRSLYDFRRSTGLQDWGARVWTTKDTEQITDENRQLRKEVRIVQGRVRDLERYSAAMTKAFREMSRAFLMRDAKALAAIETPELPPAAPVCEDDDDEFEEDEECDRIE